MPTIAVGGNVTARESDRAVPHAAVEVGAGRSLKKRILRANRSGEFEVWFCGDEAQWVQANLAKLRVRVLDTTGRALATSKIAEGDETALEIALDDAQLKKAGLRAAEHRAPLRADFLPTLNAAVGQLPSPAHSGAQAILDRLTCALPPLIVGLDVIDLAHGVLRGRSEDLRAFTELLQDSELWVTQHLGGLPRRDAQASEQLLRDLQSAQPHEHVERSETPDALVSRVDRLLLVAAAATASAGDAVRFVRNVGLVSAQLSLADRLSGVLGASREALEGAPQSLRHTMMIWAGCFGGLEMPLPREVPGGFRWGDPMPGSWDPWEPEIPTVDPCEVEMARAIGSILERRSEYSIDRIEPPNACPGETITISGSGLRFEGHTGVVWFSGPRRDMPIQALPAVWEEDRIEVVVPEGARCGPLELDIPGGAASVAVCGIEVELFFGPRTPIRFEGGETVIRAFGHTAGTCPKPGDRAMFTWDLCNATEHTLTIENVVHSDHRGSPPVFGLPPGGGLVPRASEQMFYEHIVARSSVDYQIVATLRARGPCGEDTRSVRFGVQRASSPTARPFGRDAETFVNWFGNIRRSVRVARPATLAELVEAVRAAEREGAKVGTMGSGWSYTDCVVSAPDTNLMIDTSALQRPITRVVPEALRESIVSVVPAALQTQLDGVMGPSPSVDARLIHVEAGLKIHRLNCILDTQETPLAMPTLGGSNGQSIAGAISTGTHGANPNMPPIADFVRAIHLVGPGGQQWWIEPSSRPITDPERIRALMQRGSLDPCLRLRYDEDLFFACLVSAGCAGVIYSVVIETIQAHRLTSTTSVTRWSEARTWIERTLIEPATPEPWFTEIVVNPTRAAWITTRDPVAAPPDEPTRSDDTALDALLVLLFGSAIATGPAGVGALVGLGTGAVATVVGALPFYFLRRISEIGPQFWRWGEIVDEIELIERLIRTLEDITRIISTEGDEQVVADAIPGLLNVLWQVGFYVVEGRNIVEQAQNLFTVLETRRPGTTTQRSYTAMTGQSDCPARLRDHRPPPDHSPFERLIHSSEYALPADRTLPFVEDLLGAADGMRGGNDAFILNLAIRFTTATGALIGMQQFERTGHVEVYTARGLAGNAALHAHIDRIARDHSAIPHWGQFHEVLAAGGGLAGFFGAPPLFPDLARWREAMNTVATVHGGRPNTFRHGFAIDRGLLSEL